MCVCALQTKEQENFTFDEINNMMLTNPHGAGIMWNDGLSIKYRKGFFDAKAFYNFYISVREMPTTQDVAIHARIGTGSNVDVANCHPFPITSLKKRLKASHGSCDVGVMMNGIIGSSTKELSDTALYILSNLKEYYDIDRRFFLHFSKRAEQLFENEIHGCRFVLMSKEGTKLFGVGWSDYEGKAMVSNRHWIPVKRSFDWYSYMYDDDIYYGNSNSSSKSKSYDSYDSWYVNQRAKRFAKKKNETRHKSYIDELMESVV